MSLENNRNGMDMCSGPLLKKMLIFAVPLMFSGILQLLFNAADIVVVGRFAGDNSLAAVGSNTSLINLLTNLFLGLSVGTNVMTARYFGAKQERHLKETVHTSILLSIISGLLLTIIGIIGARQILIWMSTPEAVLKLAVVYLRIYFLGMPALMVYNFGSSILRAVGDTRRPLYYLTASGVINVILNLLFVIVLKLDVAGVALATVISEFISAGLVIRCLVREKSGIHLAVKELRIVKDKFFRILEIGLPAGFQGIIFALSNVVIQSSVNGFGEIVVAGNSAAANIEGFVYLAMNAFYQSTLSFTSQNYGAGQHKRIVRILFVGEMCVIVVGLVLGNAALIFGRELLKIYTSSPAVIDAGMVRMGIIMKIYAICGIMDVMVGMLRGMGYSFVPMVISLAGVCGLRLIWLATIFQMPQFHSIEMIYITYPISWTITILAYIVYCIPIKIKMDRRIGEKSAGKEADKKRMPL